MATKPIKTLESNHPVFNDSRYFLASSPPLTTHLEILLLPFRYNLLFYINPQFYGYAAITKVLLQDVRLTCEYESTLSCISTDGNAVLTRFGLETVNPYEHLVVCFLLISSPNFTSFLTRECAHAQ